MNTRTSIAALAIAAGMLAGPLATALPPAQAATSHQIVTITAAKKYKFKNCTDLRRVYPHGVGKSGATDKTTSTPVTSFKRSTALYKKIVGYRSTLDRDKDGIACEKR